MNFNVVKPLDGLRGRSIKFGDLFRKYATYLNLDVFINQIEILKWISDNISLTIYPYQVYKNGEVDQELVASVNTKEQTLIRTLRPIFNKTHNPDFKRVSTRTKWKFRTQHVGTVEGVFIGCRYTTGETVQAKCD